MAGKSARLSIRIFFDDDGSVNDGSTRVLDRMGRQLCITPAAATLVDERTGKEWKAASCSDNHDCERYNPKISKMYWMSFHIGQDLQTTFTLLIPGLARPVKGLEPR
jgi:hypothetical protein